MGKTLVGFLGVLFVAAVGCEADPHGFFGPPPDGAWSDGGADIQGGEAPVVEPDGGEVAAMNRPKGLAPVDPPPLPVDCDLVTNAPCPRGTACAFGPGCAMPFKCVPSSGTRGEGEKCGPSGEECGPGTRCYGDTCRRFCHTDADCKYGTCSGSGCSETPSVKLCE